MLTGLCSVGGVGWAKSARLGNRPIPSVAIILADFLADCDREFIKFLLCTGNFSIHMLSMPEFPKDDRAF
jgi:hypothetical protein